MKAYTPGRIFCRCSIRMHTEGKAVQIYENTPRKVACPNCGKKRRVKVGS